MTHGRRKITWVAVADGGKALVLENDGTDEAPVLRVLAKSELENPPTREQGTDRAGRRPDPGAGQRSAMETTDWHQFEESRFIAEFAERLNRAAGRGRFERLVLVAPPKVLGELRPELSAATAAATVAEIGSDLTGHPVYRIEEHLARALGG
jgi:protein required for attachment to host cells